MLSRLATAADIPSTNKSRVVTCCRGRFAHALAVRDARGMPWDGLKERYPELQGGILPPRLKGYEMPPLPPGIVLAK